MRTNNSLIDLRDLESRVRSLPPLPPAAAHEWIRSQILHEDHESVSRGLQCQIVPVLSPVPVPARSPMQMLMLFWKGYCNSHKKDEPIPEWVWTPEPAGPRIWNASSLVMTTAVPGIGLIQCTLTANSCKVHVCGGRRDPWYVGTCGPTVCWNMYYTGDPFRREQHEPTLVHLAPHHDNPFLCGRRPHIDFCKSFSYEGDSPLQQSIKKYKGLTTEVVMGTEPLATTVIELECMEFQLASRDVPGTPTFPNWGFSPWGYTLHMMAFGPEGPNTKERVSWEKGLLTRNFSYFRSSAVRPQELEAMVNSKLVLAPLHPFQYRAGIQLWVNTALPPDWVVLDPRGNRWVSSGQGWEQVYEDIVDCADPEHFTSGDPGMTLPLHIIPEECRDDYESDGEIPRHRGLGWVSDPESPRPPSPSNSTMSASPLDGACSEKEDWEEPPPLRHRPSTPYPPPPPESNESEED
ncbi:bel2 protein [Brown greater galago prosimian foamy virus]|uniref:Bel2 protein n=1 Tax=Brown greater galago prosimian foamy virus TaxID=2170139 RepID=A0A088F653_9RETR|nr:bel2 protein [Brown greater galago prosimian foamy virus]AIM40345.1 bel2 protein [Brown greater galago prosimian foamy virus]